MISRLRARVDRLATAMPAALSKGDLAELSEFGRDDGGAA